MASKAEVYSVNSVEVLSYLAAVRKRPGMYIGDVYDGSGLHHMFWEILSNAIDEHLAGHAKRIRVSIEGQVAEIEDDGRGMMVSEYRAPRCGCFKCVDPKCVGTSVQDAGPDGGAISFLEFVLTHPHFGPTFDGHFPHVHVGLRGVGLAAVNAVCEELEVEVWRDGWTWRQRFARAVPMTSLERGVRTDRTGTRIRFRADSSIFEPTPFDPALIRTRLRELAAFNPKLTFELMTERITEPSGIKTFVHDLSRGEKIEDMFVIHELRDNVLVEVALAWATDDSGIRGLPVVRSFVGQNLTEEDGTHVSGFWKGLVDAIRIGKKHHRSAGRIPIRARAGSRFKDLRAVVHVDLRHPSFGGPTRGRLASPEVEAVVQQVVKEAYGDHLREQPRLLQRMLRH
jgi:DNA gyrase subunit B